MTEQELQIPRPARHRRGARGAPAQRRTGRPVRQAHARGTADATEPAEAAEQFTALLIGPMEARSRMGTREVGDTELRQVTRAAVRTFLQAFSPAPAP
ncbi:TetR/AcrR family transcriptional regulator C-terminal domain-containing protein [Nonomuraea dietziae]|uniref:TetR/AcrR family transcriptional regulator C-terminal domain-containing protein n=1 Tax=Nonomuraea dietziae TaxID=65515 RepID=UPI00342DA606